MRSADYYGVLEKRTRGTGRTVCVSNLWRNGKWSARTCCKKWILNIWREKFEDPEKFFRVEVQKTENPKIKLGGGPNFWTRKMEISNSKMCFSSCNTFAPFSYPENDTLNREKPTTFWTLFRTLTFDFWDPIWDPVPDNFSDPDDVINFNFGHWKTEKTWKNLKIFIFGPENLKIAKIPPRYGV